MNGDLSSDEIAEGETALQEIFPRDTWRGVSHVSRCRAFVNMLVFERFGKQCVSFLRRNGAIDGAERGNEYEDERSVFQDHGML